MNHGLKTLIMVSMVWMAGFGFLYGAFGYVLEKLGRSWKVTGVGDVAGLPLFIALFSVFMFFATPIFNTIVRVQESEADMFGLNLSREPDGMAEVALKLSEYRKMSPGPIEEFIFYDHPSGERRIRAAMTWKAYAEGLQK
jgi:STE24 endopeptidase